MKNTRISTLIVVVMLIVSLFTGCGEKTANEPQGQTPVSVTDMMGRETSLEKPAEKVVALTASDCEILYSLGAGDTVIARGEYCNYPEEALAVQAVSSGSETNLEQIIALKPDVVIMSAMAQTSEQVEVLKNAGIPVVMNNAKSIEEVYTSIEIIGKVVGKETEAAALIDEMKAGFEEIAASVTEKENKTVYFEVSPLEYGLWTAGKGTFMDEITTMLGMTNIFADVSDWAEISQEQVIERNPDYIVTITMGMEGQLPPAEEIMSRSGWQNITAVSSSKVITVDSDEISRPGPRLVDAAKGLREFFYGE
ncbi:MAG: ABC transporter substrate-binding protein [Clostridiales bacterium]|jgi:iron complex transport system substrate-binding protein|nr:ABC transporter substrate-binding protein [Clostridiales bacterium]